MSDGTDQEYSCAQVINTDWKDLIDIENPHRTHGQTNKACVSVKPIHQIKIRKILRLLSISVLPSFSFKSLLIISTGKRVDVFTFYEQVEGERE